MFARLAPSQVCLDPQVKKKSAFARISQCACKRQNKFFIVQGDCDIARHSPPTRLKLGFRKKHLSQNNNDQLLSYERALLNVHHQEEEETRKESNFHLLHKAISWSSRSFTPLIILNLLHCKNRTRVQFDHE